MNILNFRAIKYFRTKLSNCLCLHLKHLFLISFRYSKLSTDYLGVMCWFYLPQRLAIIRGAFKKYAEKFCNIETGCLFKIKSAAKLQLLFIMFRPNLDRIPYQSFELWQFLSHMEWPSGAKPDLVNNKNQICVILVQRNSEYCNQTSKNKSSLNFQVHRNRKHKQKKDYQQIWYL